MAQQNNTATTSTVEVAKNSASEKPAVENERISLLDSHAKFDEAWSVPLTVSPQVQPLIASRATPTHDDVIHAKYLNTALAAADMLERMALSIKCTTQHLLDSSLDTAAKQQNFYSRHTLTPNHVVQYGGCQTQQLAPLMQHSDRASSRRVFAQIQANGVFYPTDGTIRKRLPDGTQATLMTDENWWVFTPNGTWMRLGQ